MGAPGISRTIGRYELLEEIASGGMATVYLGRLQGPVGFARTVAIKSLHRQFARDPAFVAMFVDEARIAARIHHPNVVAIHDVVVEDGELFLVMDHVPSEALSRVLTAAFRGGVAPTPEVVCAILVGTLRGLHAAHETADDSGQPLNLIHRDVSPQNVLIGLDGIPRLIDFGVAHATDRIQTTKDGQLKGKLRYMAPEQLKRQPASRQSDLYAVGVMGWEALSGRRLIEGHSEAELLSGILTFKPEAIADVAGVTDGLRDVFVTALATDPDDRYPTALEMAMAIEEQVNVASPTSVGSWVEQAAGDLIQTSKHRLESSLRGAGSSHPVATPVQEVQASAAPAIAALPSEHSPLTRRARTGLLVAGVLVAGAATGTGIVLATSSAPSETPVSTNTVASIVPVEAQPAAELPMASAEPRTAPSVSVVGTSSAVPATPRRAVRTTRPTRPAAKPKPKTAPNCSPPYTISADGVRTFKRACL